VVRLIVTGGSLTQRPKRSLRCLLVEVLWQINLTKWKVAMAQFVGSRPRCSSQKPFKNNWYKFHTLSSWTSFFSQLQKNCSYLYWDCWHIQERHKSTLTLLHSLYYSIVCVMLHLSLFVYLFVFTNHLFLFLSFL